MHVEHLSFHHKGNYVLLALLPVFKGTGELLTQIIEMMIPKFSQLVLDQHGICLVNKAITLITEQRQAAVVVSILAENIV